MHPAVERIGADLLAALERVVREFQRGFETSDGSSAVPKEEQQEALEEDEVDQETVKVNKPAPAAS